MTDEIKTGNRNNTDDRARIRQVRAKAREIDALTLELEPNDSDETMEQQIIAAHDGKGMRFKVLTAPTGERAPIPQEATKRLKAYDEYTDPGYKVLGVPFGGPVSGRDATGEAFHAGTDIWLKVGDEVNLTYYHGFGPDSMDAWQEQPVLIGRAKYIGTDERGHWFDPRLDEGEPLARRVMVAPENVRASSGAVGHLVRMGESGMIDVWPVGELALFDTNEWRRPANEYAITESKSAEVTMTEDAVQADDAKTAPVQGEAAVTDIDNPVTETLEEFTMDENEIKALIADGIKAGMDEVKAAVSAELTPDKLGGILTSGKAPEHLKTANLGDPDPVQDFNEWVVTGKGKIKAHTVMAELSDGRGGKVKAALQEGTDSEGGYLVPADYLNRIIEKRSEMSLLSRLGVQTYSTDRDQFTFPTEGTSMTAFTIVAEEADMSAAENEPTFGSAGTPPVTLYKFKKLIKISEELDEDYNTGLSSFLSSAIGRAWALTENYYVQIGSGSSAPQGAFVGGTAGLTLDSASAIGAAEVPELIGKLKIPYRDRAVLVMNRTTGAYLSGLFGTSGFSFHTPPASQIWANGEDLGIGYPVILTENAAAIGGGYKSMLFGNFDFYGWVTNRSLKVRRLVELYAQTGQIGLMASFRAGGAVLQAEAFQYATHPTA